MERNESENESETGVADAASQESPQQVDARRTLGRVRELIVQRDAQLRRAEFVLLTRVRTEHITLLNPVSRKLHVQFMELMNSTLQLDCKMIRRNLFYLRCRERKLLAVLGEDA